MYAIFSVPAVVPVIMGVVSAKMMGRQLRPWEERNSLHSRSTYAIYMSFHVNFPPESLTLSFRHSASRVLERLFRNAVDLMIRQKCPSK